MNNNAGDTWSAAESCDPMWVYGCTVARPLSLTLFESFYSRGGGGRGGRDGGKSLRVRRHQVRCILVYFVVLLHTQALPIRLCTYSRETEKGKKEGG